MKKRERQASLISRTPLLVRFSEVDSMQIVWHGSYVKYFEDGREQFGREYSGLGYMDFYASGYAAPIVDLQIQYKKPLICNDRAIIETRYINSDAAKIIFEYTIYKEDSGEIIATGSSIQVFLNSSGELELLSPKFYLEWKKRWNVK